MQIPIRLVQQVEPAMGTEDLLLKSFDARGTPLLDLKEVPLN